MLANFWAFKVSVEIWGLIKSVLVGWLVGKVTERVQEAQIKNNISALNLYF